MGFSKFPCGNVEDGLECLDTRREVRRLLQIVLARDGESLWDRHEEGTDVRYSKD